MSATVSYPHCYPGNAKGEYLAPSNNETAVAKVKTTLTNKNPWPSRVGGEQ